MCRGHTRIMAAPLTKKLVTKKKYKPNQQFWSWQCPLLGVETEDMREWMPMNDNECRYKCLIFSLCTDKWLKHYQHNRLVFIIQLPHSQFELKILDKKKLPSLHASVQYFKFSKLQGRWTVWLRHIHIVLCLWTKTFVLQCKGIKILPVCPCGKSRRISLGDWLVSLKFFLLFL